MQLSALTVSALTIPVVVSIVSSSSFVGELVEILFDSVILFYSLFLFYFI